MSRNKNTIQRAYLLFYLFNILIKGGYQELFFLINDSVIDVGNYLITKFVWIIGNGRQMKVKILLKLIQELIIREKCQAMYFFLGCDFYSC